MSAIVNENYIVDQDSSVGFQSPIVDLESALSAINYQVLWDADVSGELVWQASIFDDPFRWEDLVNCKAVKLNIPGDGNGNNHSIVSIDGIWLTVGFLRFDWRPSNSTGNLNVSIRIVPIP